LLGILRREIETIKFLVLAWLRVRHRR